MVPTSFSGITRRLAAPLLLIAGYSPSQPESAAESQPSHPQSAAVAETVVSQAFEPQYIGGYPTAETADHMFEECGYRAALQFYLGGYAYLSGMGVE